MPNPTQGRECYHCRNWIPEGVHHNCWATTEEKLTEGLSEDLMDAWHRIRETAVSFGTQRIYASHKSILFARTHCYFFVRPKPKKLELCFLLGRTVSDPRVKRAEPASKRKQLHTVDILHRDQVEPPLTDWLREAYIFTEEVRALPTARLSPRTKKKAGRKKATRKKTAVRSRRPKKAKTRQRRRK